jgi:two-component system response regulator HydG
MANVSGASTKSQPLVLVVDDDEAARTLVLKDLAGTCRVLSAPDIATGLALCRREQAEVVLLDVEVPKEPGGPCVASAGVDAIADFRAASAVAEVVIFSQHDKARLGMEALRRGAFDFVVKPYYPEEILSCVARALERGRTQREVAYLRGEVDALKGGGHVYGRTETMARIKRLLEAAAPTDAPVLITGETGTGKELVARALHAGSGRPGPFIAVHLAAVPADLVESTLFGHERGAFTGALRSQPGRFEIARGGTLFFDEIGELSPATQVKLLRVVQEGEFERVGGTRVTVTDVRIVAATHRNLREEVKKGTFREDLFFRLNVVPIELPPLRERLEDLPALAALFLERHARRYGRGVRSIHPGVVNLLRLYEWPGNIRELEHLIQRMVVVKSQGVELVESDLPLEYRYPAFLQQSSSPGRAPGDEVVLRAAIEAFEQDFILKTLARCNWNRNRAAELLGIHRATMFRKLNRHGLYGSAVEPLHPSAGRAEREPDDPDA